MHLFGHPLHPLLVHFPIACWGLASLCDGLTLFGFDQFWPYAGGLIATGVALALPAMIAGFIDLVGAPTRAVRDANIHMLLMSSAWTIYLISLLLRLEGRELMPEITISPIALSGAGLLLMAIGGWYGGQLVYTHGIGTRFQEDDKAD